jgi:ADP-ribosylglycohydrolase
LESTDYESSIRLAVSLARDADTLACITGGITEAYYKHIPAWMKDKAYSLLPPEFIDFFNKILGDLGQEQLNLNLLPRDGLRVSLFL